MSITKAVKCIKLLAAVPVLVSLFCTVNASPMTTTTTSNSVALFNDHHRGNYSSSLDNATAPIAGGRNNFSLMPVMTVTTLLPPSSTLSSNNNNTAAASNSTTPDASPNLMRSPSVQIFFGVLYAFIFVVGIAGNVLVCYVVFRNKAMQTVTNYFITNLALSDILLCILAVPFTPLYTFLERWVFGSPLCHIVPYAQGCSVYISTLTLTAVAIDRFFVIVYPFQPRMKLSVCISIIVSIWVFALLVTLPYGLYMRIQEDSGHNYCEENWPEPTSIKIIFSICTTMLQFAIPFLMITVCYISVSVKLNDRARTKPGSKTSKREEADRDRKKRTNRMLIAMVAVFGISWMPLNVYNIRADLRPIEDTSEDNSEYSLLIFFVTHAIAMSSTCYNPFLYAWLNENFRKEFIQILPCLFRALSPLNGSGSGGNTGTSRNNNHNRSRRCMMGPTSTYDPDRLPQPTSPPPPPKSGQEIDSGAVQSDDGGAGEGQQRLLTSGNSKCNGNNCDSESKFCQRQQQQQPERKDSSVLGLCSKVAGNVFSRKPATRDPTKSGCLSATQIPLVVDPISSCTSSSCTTATSSSTISGHHLLHHFPVNSGGKATTVSQLSPQHTSVDTTIVTLTSHSAGAGGSGGGGGGSGGILETHFEEMPQTTKTTAATTSRSHSVGSSSEPPV